MEAFARGILRVAANPTFAQELGLAAREHVAKNYSWEQAAERVERVYEALIPATSERDRGEVRELRRTEPAARADSST